MTANDGKPSNPSDDSQQLSVAERLRELIGKAGLSQRGAARELGVDDRTMRYWCSGDQTPPPMVMRALDPATRHRENLRRTIADNQRQIDAIESGIVTGLGYGPRRADASGAAAEAQRLRRQNEELQALLRQEDAFQRRQEAFFALHRQWLPHGNGLPTEEAIAEFDAAEEEWRAAQKEVDLIVEQIRAGLR